MRFFFHAYTLTTHILVRAYPNNRLLTLQLAIYAIFLKNSNKPFIISFGLGGQPGIW